MAQGVFAKLPKEKVDQYVTDIVLGRRTQVSVAKELGCSDMAVVRWMAKVTEEQRLEIVARTIQEHRMKAALEHAEIVNEFGDDVQRDVRWLLRELKELLATSKGDEDRILQLGTLKELRQSLLALADLQGKLSKKVEVTFALHESPAFLELRRVIMEVLENHPEAKADFLDRMGALKVVNSKEAAKQLK